MSASIHTAYIICAIQRSGSFLLCESLKTTRLGGMPEEYFLMWEDGWWAQQHGVETRDQFLNLVREKGTTTNGVFGTKIMWNYFAETIDKLRELPRFSDKMPHQILSELFPNLHYIWIVRDDKVRQAVSWTIAAQTGVYSADQFDPNNPPPDPIFDYEQIDLLHGMVLEGESGWANYFAENNISPAKVVYEDLVENYEETALRLLDFMDIPYSAEFQFADRKMRKQSTSRNADWAKRYRQQRTQTDFTDKPAQN